MTPRDLASYLAELEAAGVAQAELSWGDTKICVRFDPRPAVTDPKAAEKLPPEDDMPPLADTNAIDKLYRKNFPASR